MVGHFLPDHIQLPSRPRAICYRSLGLSTIWYIAVDPLVLDRFGTEFWNIYWTVYHLLPNPGSFGIVVWAVWCRAVSHLELNFGPFATGPWTIFYRTVDHFYHPLTILYYSVNHLLPSLGPLATGPSTICYRPLTILYQAIDKLVPVHGPFCTWPWTICYRNLSHRPIVTGPHTIYHRFGVWNICFR